MFYVLIDLLQTFCYYISNRMHVVILLFLPPVAIPILIQLAGLEALCKLLM